MAIWHTAAAGVLNIRHLTGRPWYARWATISGSVIGGMAVAACWIFAAVREFLGRPGGSGWTDYLLLAAGLALLGCAAGSTVWHFRRIRHRASAPIQDPSLGPFDR